MDFLAPLPQLFLAFLTVFFEAHSFLLRVFDGKMEAEKLKVESKAWVIVASLLRLETRGPGGPPAVDWSHSLNPPAPDDNFVTQ